ncbi:MAG: site-specific DNA-methyltransferase, partial [Methylophilaceae bacterium]|nr:site-specific DNA-methyltransferase [Methylophilaceae bacterium]
MSATSPSHSSKAVRNRTLTVEEGESRHLRDALLEVNVPIALEHCLNRTICGDTVRVLPLLPKQTIDLLIVDPPYNLTKTYSGNVFTKQSSAEYETWLETWLSWLVPLLKPTASLYVCSDWRSSASVQSVLETHFVIQNRITWEREKGRGALQNWKNCAEDIWFCTMSDDYYFNVEAVKHKRRVLAPYRHTDGSPKDWQETDLGDFRLTHPSNLWTDISVPFWSMPENTEHPTQKPEKLIAKLVLASSKPSDVVLDPFLGSGTTSVVAKKLGRQFIGIEREQHYCLLAEKRLALAQV